MTTLRPYPEYKPSGATWLEDVPAHWNIHPLLRLAGERQESNRTGSVSTVLSLSYGNIVVKDVSRLKGLLPENFHTYQIIDPGNIVLRLTDLQNDQRSLRVGLAKNFGIITSAYLALQVHPSSDPRFLYRYLHNFDVQKLLYGLGSGVRQGMGYADMKRVPVAVPPLAEQQAIADFLDVADARISRYIAAKRHMIALLEEQKQAIINQAVTRGLDPDVPLKPSGVDWLGDIPAHWEVKKVGTLTALIQTGPFGSQLPASEYIEGGVPLINPSHISSGSLAPASDISVGEATAARLSRHRFWEGDVVLARRGEMGRCAVIRDEHVGWLCGTGSLLLRPLAQKILPDYLQMILSNRSLAEWLVLTSAGATMSNLNTTMVSQVTVCLPSIKEQRSIIAHVIEREWYYQGLIARSHRETELIQEYRSRLISDVVTGKLDVRGVELPALEDPS